MGGTTGLLINIITADLAVPAEAWQCFCEFASLATFWPVAFQEALYKTLNNRGLKRQVAAHKRRQQAAPMNDAGADAVWPVRLPGGSILCWSSIGKQCSMQL